MPLILSPIPPNQVPRPPSAFIAASLAALNFSENQPPMLPRVVVTVPQNLTTAALTESQFSAKATSPAITAAIPATIHVMGLASMATFKPSCAAVANNVPDL
ncbi:hypothetical protein D3C71_1649530 [compost metagenome]